MFLLAPPPMIGERKMNRKWMGMLMLLLTLLGSVRVAGAAAQVDPEDASVVFGVT